MTIANAMKRKSTSNNRDEFCRQAKSSYYPFETPNINWWINLIIGKFIC
jgi:hypothetical protein